MQQIPGDSPDQTAERQNRTIEESEDNCPALGFVPEYVSVCKPETIKWGKRIDGSEIILQTSVITDAYNEIVTWRKNVFLVPYGKTGRDLSSRDQVTSHINDWNNGANLRRAFQSLVPSPKPKSTRSCCQNVLYSGKTGKSTSCCARVGLFKVE